MNNANADTPRSEDNERERWNTRFAAGDYVFGTAPNAFLAAQASRLRPGMTALCVADGEGRNSVWLARQGLVVTAFDFSTAGLAKARALAAKAGVRVDYRESDVAHWSWASTQYDVVVAIFVQFASPPLRAQMFAGMIEATKPGGLVIVQGYGPKQLEYATGGPKELENLYTLDLLRESFGALDIAHLAAHDELITEGAGHHGMSALIDMVARKPPPGAAGEGCCRM
jgi:SAM-dependent methyltransferase